MVGVPFWMISVLTGRPCPTCQRPVELDDIIGVAVRLGGNGDPSARPTVGPITYIITQCGCGATHTWLATVEQKKVKAGVECIFKLAAAARAERLRDAGDETCDGNCAGETRGSPSASDDEKGATAPRRPRRRPPMLAPSKGACPKAPLLQPEVDWFLKQLRMTSFRRDTLSFRNFMKRLGYRLPPPESSPPVDDDDPDKPPF